MHLRPWQPQSLARSCFSLNVARISAVCQVCLGNENRRSFKTYGTGAGWVLPWIYALTLTPWAEKWAGDPLQCPSVYVSPQELHQGCQSSGIVWHRVGFWGWVELSPSKSGHSVVLFLPLAEEENYFLPSFFSPSLWSAAGQGCFKRRDGPSAAPESDGAEEVPVPPGWNVSQLLFLWIHHFLDVPWDSLENLDNKKPKKPK